MAAPQRSISSVFLRRKSPFRWSDFGILHARRALRLLLLRAPRQFARARLIEGARSGHAIGQRATVMLMIDLTDPSSDEEVLKFEEVGRGQRARFRPDASACGAWIAIGLI